MSNRREAIKGIVKKDTLELEQFQNQVLRPILKGQHDLLIANFQYYTEQRKINFENCKDNLKSKHIEAILSKDIAFKNLQLGLVIGHFTNEEYAVYTFNSAEYNKRILQMLKKRLKDTFV